MKMNCPARTTMLLTTLLALAVQAARATDLTGTYTTTQLITADSRLVGNVICNVAPGTPCIKFGTSGTAMYPITLNLRGFSMTGQGNPFFAFCIGPTVGESGISTGGFSHLRIVGTGLVWKFGDNAIDITAASTNVEVSSVTLSQNCSNGVRVSGNGNNVSGNVPVLNGNLKAEVLATLQGLLSSPGVAGIAVQGNGNTVKNNQVNGNLAGILVFGNGNSIQENSFGGGVFFGLWVDTGARGNAFRKNIVAGNFELDILNASALNANLFQNDLCLTSSGPNVTCPTTPAEVVGHENYN